MGIPPDDMQDDSLELPESDAGNDTEDTFDLLSELRAGLDDLESSAPGESEEVNDLDDLFEDTDLTFPSSEEPVQPEAPQTTSPPADMPDWLKAAAPTEQATESDSPEWLGGEAPGTSAFESETPDWLNAGAPDSDVPAASPPAAQSQPDAAAPEPEPIPEDIDLFEQLAAPSTSAEETPEPAAAESNIEADFLDLFADEGTEPQPAAESTPTEADDSDLLAGLLGIDSKPAAEEAPVETPDWLDSLTEGVEEVTPSVTETSAPPDAELPADEAMPDWLSALEDMPDPDTPAADSAIPDAKTAETQPPAVPQVTEESVTEDAPLKVDDADFLRSIGIEPDDAPEEPAPPIADAMPEIRQGTSPLPSSPDWLLGIDLDQIGVEGGDEEDDLLGLGDFVAAEEEGEETAADTPIAMPDWLASGDDAPGVENLAPGVFQVEEAPADFLEQIDDLRFDAITEDIQPTQDEGLEKVGALKDMSGVVQPELIFEGTSLAVGDLVDDIVVTDSQQNQVEQLHKMLRRESEGISLSGRRPFVLPAIRITIAMALLAAVIIPFLGISILPHAVVGPHVVAAYETIEALPDGAAVVAAFEYEPDTVGELQPLAEILLAHLAERNATVYTLSTKPTGPLLADYAAAETDFQPGTTWVNLGFVSGNTTAVSGLTIGSVEGITSPFELDTLGQPTDLAARNLRELSPDLVIVFSARAENLRPWVEQAGPVLNAPILVATSAGAAPLAYPYLASEQIAGVLSGINGAVGYQAYRSDEVAPGILQQWNGQALGGAVASLAILIGGLGYGIVSLRNRQEQA